MAFISTLPLGIQGEPDCIYRPDSPSLYNLTSGRRSWRLHQYPAFGGRAQENGTILFLGC